MRGMVYIYMNVQLDHNVHNISRWMKLQYMYGSDILQSCQIYTCIQVMLCHNINESMSFHNVCARARPSVCVCVCVCVGQISGEKFELCEKVRN